MSVDRQQGPIRVTTSPFPDLEPVWSPGGREIAYVSWRSGSQDILILDLNNPSEGSAVNITHTPDIHEHNPEWSPDGRRLAYDATANGVQGIYIKEIESEDEARLVGRGRTPVWNPIDGSSLFYSVPQGRNSALYLGQVDAFGVGANAIAFDGQITDLDWALGEILFSGFGLQTPPLYQEVVERREGRVDLRLLNGVEAPYPVLSDTVNDSFEAMRQRIQQKVGYDLLSSLEDAYWRIDSQEGPPRLPEPGQERTNWHYTGRAIALQRDLALVGNPPSLVVIREETELGTMWRVLARVAESGQNGQLGDPLRTLPWDFTTRSEDPVAFEEGGSLMEVPPAGYYVDLTQLLSDFGWERIRADRTWRTNFSGVLYWVFVKTEGLTWQEAMQQIYTIEEFDAFLTGITPPPPTPIPTATPRQESTEAPTAVDEVG
jgi:TolB protein